MDPLTQAMRLADMRFRAAASSLVDNSTPHGDITRVSMMRLNWNDMTSQQRREAVQWIRESARVETSLVRAAILRQDTAGRDKHWRLGNAWAAVLDRVMGYGQ